MKRLLRLIACLLLCALLLAAAPQRSAQSEGAAIQAAAQNILCVKAYWNRVTILEAGINKERAYTLGEGFLVGSIEAADGSTQAVLVTNAHCILDSTDDAGAADRVVVLAAAAEINASVAYRNEDCDLAILYLDAALLTQEALPLRREEAAPNEPVYALSFAAQESEWHKVGIPVTVPETEITEGVIESLTQATAAGSSTARSVDAYLHSAKPAADGGGPLLDAQGAVIGVNFTTTDGSVAAVRIQELCSALDALGVSYTTVQQTASPPIPTQEPTPTAAEQAETDALDQIPTDPPQQSASSAEMTQQAPLQSADGDPAQEDPHSTVLVILVCIAALLAGLSVSLILLWQADKKRRKALPSTRNAVQADKSVIPCDKTEDPSNIDPLDKAQAQSVPNEEEQAEAYLERISTGERLPITDSPFRIGRALKHSGRKGQANAAIYRSRASITYREGEYLLSDGKTADHTCVNEKEIHGRTELPIVQGDVIRIAGEEFIFTVR